VLPGAERLVVNDINRIMGRSDLSMGDKFGMSEAVLRRRLKPFSDEIGHAISRANIPEHVGEEFGKAIPYMAAAAAKAGPAAAKAFIGAWLHSGAWGMFLSAAYLGHKAGAFGALGKALSRGGSLGGLGDRGTPANPLFVVSMDGGGPGIPGGKGGSGKGWLSKLGGGAAAFAGTAAARVGGAAGAFILGSGLAGGPFGSDAGLSPAEERRRLQSLRSRQRPIPNNSRGRFLGEITVVHSHVYLNGKEIAGAVAEEARDATARRGR
jgi:hypothetical protein